MSTDITPTRASVLLRLARGFRCVGLAAFLLATVGCVVNPLTGEQEIGWISVPQQISIGEQHYVPAQQMQGGQYSVDPALSQYVSRVGERLAQRSPLDLPYEFVVLNNSVPNAWAMPGGKIAINRGLLVELSSEAELAAVLGHEIAHAAGRHGAKAQERGTVLQVALMAAAIGASNTEYAGAVVGAGQVAAGLVTTKNGRNAEREADFYGTRFMAEAGYDPAAAVTLQETFVRLSEGRQSNWLEGLFSTHPPSQERVDNNRGLAAELRAEFPQARERGTREYQRVMSPTLAARSAYDAYDEARTLAAGGNMDGALEKLSVALAARPQEARFHALRGDIRRQQKRYADAKTNYDRAIARDDGYFADFLGRGIVTRQLGNASQAKQDLNRSVGLLPTAIAYNELGKIAESEGNQDDAVRYYAAAAESGGEAGQTALTSLVRIDLPRRPAQYLVAGVRSDAGRPVLVVQNRTPAAVRNVLVNYELVWADGKVTRDQTRLTALGASSGAQVRLPAREGVLLSSGRAETSAAQLQ